MSSSSFEPPEVTVRLDVYGFRESPEEITGLLGLSPTDVWFQGELVPGSIVEHKENHWIIDSGPHRSLLDATQSVLDIAWPAAARFAALPSDARVQLYCVIYDLDRTVTLSFPVPTLEKLAALRAELNLVYYGFMSDEE